MDLDELQRRGLVLLGCGRMGSAMLAGWLADGFPPEAVHVVEPRPSAWLAAQGVALNGPLPARPGVVLIAVKPQMMDAALPGLTTPGPDTLVLSVAAGTPIARYEAAFGAEVPVVRAMPNTPAAIGRGVSAIVGNAAAAADHLDLAERLLSAVGAVVRLDAEAQMDAVTAVSGSGPAYVFHMVEALAAAGVAEGLDPGLAMRLARATVCGAGALLDRSQESAAELRENVTSPQGTTAAGLAVLMAEPDGLGALMRRTVAAAADRSRELGR
jgi:pyrroline-5-carboxylate reductase